MDKSLLILIDTGIAQLGRMENVDTFGVKRASDESLYPSTVEKRRQAEKRWNGNIWPLVVDVGKK